MLAAPLSWRRYGERGVLIELSSLDEVHTLYEAAKAAGIARECVPGARTLYLDSDESPEWVIQRLSSVASSTPSRPNVTTHTIDVLYDGADLADVAALTGLSEAEVIKRHTSALYTVAFLGFSRSFPYLAGLDPALVVPRLATPRTVVPAGSVAMGAEFTGVYPMASPGGWRLLGRTSQTFFDEHSDPPSTLRIGDRVTFRPAS
jgi:KipI family sensor histidine kinase inhibitor